MYRTNLRYNSSFWKQLAVEKTKCRIPPRPPKVAGSTTCKASHMPNIKKNVQHIFLIRLRSNLREKIKFFSK